MNETAAVAAAANRTVLSFYLQSSEELMKSGIPVPILQMKILRSREVTWFA